MKPALRAFQVVGGEVVDMSTGGSSSMSTSGVSNLFADIRKVGGLEFVMRIQSDVVAQLYIISMYNPARTELMEISIPAKTAQPMTFSVNQVKSLAVSVSLRLHRAEP